jgi:hypothetical protein
VPGIDAQRSQLRKTLIFLVLFDQPFFTSSSFQRDFIPFPDAVLQVAARVAQLKSGS